VYNQAAVEMKTQETSIFS